MWLLFALVAGGSLVVCSVTVLALAAATSHGPLSHRFHDHALDWDGWLPDVDTSSPSSSLGGFS